MNKTILSLSLAAAICLNAGAQQSNVNLSYNPQFDTEGLIPFSASLNSPQVNDDHTVTFRIKAPKASEVKLSGAMLTVMHQKEPLPFTRGEDGIWTLTIGPLPVDMYQYNIIVDGVSMADPNNTYAAFTAMPPYSELIVHGDGPQWYDARPVPHGSVTRHIYTSSVTGGERDMYVYTPPTYVPRQHYPVLYLMGGSGELPSNWMYDGRVNFIMDNLLAEGKAQPMIIAIINNQVVHRNHPQHADLTFDIMARELREVIVPFVDAHYPTIANPHGRALSGLSMGGRHTMFSGMERNLDLFANFGVLSAGDPDPMQTMPRFMNTPNVNDQIDYLFIGQGTEEQSGFFNVRVKGLVDALKAHGIEHEYYAGGHGGHDWSTWRHLLYYRFLPNLFKNQGVASSTPVADPELWAAQNHKLMLKADRGVMQNPLELDKFIQIAIIVEDIDVAAREWAELLNVPVPEVKLHQTVDTTDPNLNYYGKNYKYGLKLASILAPQGFIIELHQILDDNPSTYLEFVREHGYGVHHLGFAVGERRDAVVNELIERGYLKRVEHFYPGGSWTIIDTEQSLGVNLNIKPAM